MTGKIYRGIKASPMSEEDFISHREAQARCSADGPHGECDCWGLSVWVSEDAVNHARAANGFAKKWYIAAGDVVPEDGVIMATPTKAQPQHHSFFRDINSDLKSKFKIVLNPAVQ